MHTGGISLGVILVSMGIIVCVSTNPVAYTPNKPSSTKEHLSHLAKVFNTLRRLELGGKGTNTRGYRHGRFGGNRHRESYSKLEATDSRARQTDQNEAEKIKNLESYMMRNEDKGEGVVKRQGNWDYDYGLGGGRFGKRTAGDYGIGGGRFGRDVSDVDHVDLADVE